VGAEDVAIEPYRGAAHYGLSHAPLFVLGALGSRLLATKALILFELEYSGRRQYLRRWLPRGEGANVIGRLPARGPRERTSCSWPITTPPAPASHSTRGCLRPATAAPPAPAGGCRWPSFRSWLWRRLPWG
jgi:hypothetical protein